MEKRNNNDFDRLLVQLSCREFFEMFDERIQARKSDDSVIISAPERCYGIRELAERLGCSTTTIYYLLRDNVLDDSIISHIGRAYVFDVEKARACANIYMDNKKRTK